MLNTFSMLDAQTAEGALATVGAHELPAEHTSPVCLIETTDIGDEDCRKVAFDVVECGTNHIWATTNRRELAVAWIADNGFTLAINP